MLGQVAPALQVFLYLRWLESESDDSVTNASVEADAGCEEPPTQNVQVLNEQINDPEKQTAILGGVWLRRCLLEQMRHSTGAFRSPLLRCLYYFFPHRD